MKTKYFKVIALIALGVFAGLIIYPLMSGDNVYEQIEKYRYVLNTAIDDYVEEVDVGKLTEAAIRGMLNELDPHSTYMSAKEFKGEDESMQGSFEGIGVEFRLINDSVTVMAPIKGGPSEKAGIIAGDKIVEVNGASIVSIQQDSVPKVLKGPKGTIVTLGISRAGEKKLLSFDIVRDKIPLHSVAAYYMVPNTDIGIINVGRFAATTYDELVKAANELKVQGMQKLILDLRGNPGGLLEQAFYMADEFLPGDTIVYTKARKASDNEVYIARKGNQFENIPLIVLIDAASASASEIVSGSVQDLDRGLVVGTNSFGKGLVQRQYIIRSDASALRLTIARYYTASGRCIQRPYENKEDYRKLVGRLELEEGANLEHALDKIKKEDAEKNKNGKNKKDNSINMDSIEVFYTRSGRPVLGGGGITPDYIVKYDSLTSLFYMLIGKGVVSEFISVNYKNGKEVKEKYANDFNKFYKEYEVTNSMMKEIKAIAEKKEIEWEADKFKNDEANIKTYIKSQIARIVWDGNREEQVRSSNDRQIKKALELFPIAEQIKNKKKAKKN